MEIRRKKNSSSGLILAGILLLLCSACGAVITTPWNGAAMDLVLPDPEDNEVRLGDLISQNRVTMLNIWGISCGPCLSEIPYLARLREKYKDQGFEIIGLTADLFDETGNIDPELLEKAKAAAGELGVSYPVLVMTGDALKQMKVIVVPTTCFVNSTGQVIGKTIMGARSEEQWERLIRDALEK